MNQSELHHLVSALRIHVGKPRKLPDSSHVGRGVGMQRLRKRVRKRQESIVTTSSLNWEKGH